MIDRPRLRTWHAILPAVPESAGVARQLARDRLRAWRLTVLADDVVLVISELAANAVMAARAGRPAPITFCLVRTSKTVLVAVANKACGPARPLLPNSPALLDRAEPETALTDAEDGRGLTIVAALAQRLRWYRLARWTIVCAQFRTDGRLGPARTLSRAAISPAAGLTWLRTARGRAEHPPGQ